MELVAAQELRALGALEGVSHGGVQGGGLLLVAADASLGADVAAPGGQLRGSPLREQAIRRLREHRERDDR